MLIRHAKLFFGHAKCFLHSNEKLRVFASEAFRSEKSTETSNHSTEVSVETHEPFESISKSPKFRFSRKLENFIRNFVFFNGIFRVLFNDDMSSNIILIRDFFSQISWPLGSLVSGVDFEPKDPGFNPHTAQKRRKKKSMFYQASRKQNQLFHGFNSKSTSETLGHEFCM
jgi:hypothetical protein